MPTLKALQERMNQAKREMKEQGGDAVREALKEFFSHHDAVQAVRWRQYTPYFNDGDACIFSVNEPEFKITGIDGDEDDGFVASYELRAESCYKDARELSRALDEAEDALFHAFGDHCEVVAHRHGDVDVNEYEHD